MFGKNFNLQYLKFLLAFFITGNLNAQSHSIGFTIGSGIGNQYGNETLNANHKIINSQLIQLEYSRQASENFILGSGARYSLKGSKYNVLGNEGLIHYHYIGIPLIFKYNVFNSIYVSPHPSINYLLTDYHVVQGNPPVKNRNTLDIKNIELEFAFAIGIDDILKQSNKHNLGLDLFTTTSLTNNSSINVDGSIRNYTVMVRLGYSLITKTKELSK